MAESRENNGPDGLPVVRDIHDLARIFVKTLREISSRGDNITFESLTKSLSQKEEIVGLVELAGRDSNTLALPILEDEIERLKKKLQDKEDERKKLSSRLFDCENLLDREVDFGKRLSLTLLRLARNTENTTCFDLFDRYKRLLMENADLENREDILSGLRSRIVKMEMGGGFECTEEEKKPGIKGFFGRKKDPLADVRKAWLQTLADIMGVIGKKYAPDIETVRRRVIDADDLDYLLSLRKAVVDILVKFAGDMEKDKESLTGFLRDVGEKLTALEKSIMATTEANTHFNRASLDFNESIDSDLASVRSELSKDGGSQIESFKNMLIERLEKISSALSLKREEYVIKIEDGEKEQAELQQHFKNVISTLQDKNRILEEQSSRDPLTGIYNRRVFKERIEMEFERFVRYKTGFSLLFFDVDHFKQVNDTYGHEAGDRALKGIAQSTRSVLRKSDVFARFGGEEFVVILFETDIDHALVVAEKLRDLIENAEFMYEGRRVPITISIGVTESRESDADSESVIKRSDSLLYRAKELGRNRVVSDLDVPGGG